jgi:hypothetical protein
LESRLRDYFRSCNEKRLIIVGTGRVVQINETVICRSGKIRCPSAVDDDIKDIVWIVGIVDAKDPTNFL